MSAAVAEKEWKQRMDAEAARAEQESFEAYQKPGSQGRHRRGSQPNTEAIRKQASAKVIYFRIPTAAVSGCEFLK